MICFFVKIALTESFYRPGKFWWILHEWYDSHLLIKAYVFVFPTVSCDLPKWFDIGLDSWAKIVKYLLFCCFSELWEEQNTVRVIESPLHHWNFFKQISFKFESLVKFTTHIVNCDHICIKLHSSSSWQLTKRTCGLDDECLAWKTTASPRLVSLVKEKVYTIFIVLVALQIFLLKPACYFTTGWVTQWKSLLKKIHVVSGSYEFQAQLVFILFSGRRI